MASQAAPNDDDELERTRTLVAEPAQDAAASEDVGEDTAVLETLSSEEPDDVLEIEVELDLGEAPPAASSPPSITPPIHSEPVAAQPMSADDQALELAALRAEVARLNREHLELHRLLRLREKWLQTLQEDLDSSQAQFRETTCLLSEAQVQLVLLKESQARAEAEPPKQAVAKPAVTADPLADADAIVVEEIELLASPGVPLRELPVSDDLAPTQRIPPTATSADALLDSQATDPEQLPEGLSLMPLEPAGPLIVLERQTTTLGRAHRNNVCIHSPAVSRDHARIVVSAGIVTVFDMDSANGCYVNDDRVKQQKLFDGDVLRLGDCSYLFSDKS